ncbi:DegT/DnrJ/EryC1/StrS family aminotransferase [Bacteroidota bacterium]
MKIPITKTYFDDSDYENIQKPLKSGWVVQGPFVKEFEERFSKFVKSKYSIASSSCTTALHIALAALGIKKGDEVIVPAFTWVSTANAIEFTGAKPIFCDIDLRTFNIDANQIEEKITDKTKAIIPVHLFGLPADMDAVLRISMKYNLKIVEDAACGFGAYYKNKHVGNFGDFGCFSFHPRKAITTGEGGMITTQIEELDKSCRILRNHGEEMNRDINNASEVLLLSEFNILGYNYRMTDIQGALGVSQMDKADWIQKQRTGRAKKYDELLEDLNWLQKPFCDEESKHGYQSYVCLFQPEEITMSNIDKLGKMRNDLMINLQEKGISTRQGTHAVTMLGYYKNKYRIKNEDYPNAMSADRLSIALPLYPQMTDEEQEYVLNNLKSAYEKL